MNNLLPYMLLFCQITVGIIFTVSFLGKIRDVLAFERTITGLNIIPMQFSRGAAFLVLISGLAVVGLLLIGGKVTCLGFTIAILNLSVFTISLLHVLRSGISISCNCFGVSTKPISIYDVIRNIAIMLCSVIGLMVAFTQFQAGYQENLGLTNIALTSVLALVAVLILTNFSEIMQLFQ